MKMKIELSADLAEMVSGLLHGYQESVAYDAAFASYCGEFKPFGVTDET